MDKNKKSQSTKAIEEQIKMLQNEDISDRTPIISLLVDKWKHVNKLKKSMTEILEKVLVEVVKAVGKGAAKIIVWTAHQIEKK